MCDLQNHGRPGQLVRTKRGLAPSQSIARRVKTQIDCRKGWPSVPHAVLTPAHVCVSELGLAGPPFASLGIDRLLLLLNRMCTQAGPHRIESSFYDNWCKRMHISSAVSWS